ncbi:zinc finger protein Xfin-like [Lytechinus pictus]|uniref:zinc finger protein Xfin-like n=1 Tax=Lytechinus pictus TaxID=7653 RepID=UPI0030B9F6D6
MSSECTGKDLSQEQSSIKDYSKDSQGVYRPHLPASIENSCDLGEERSQRCLRGSNDLACHVSVDHRSSSLSCCKFSSNLKDIAQKQSHAQSESKKGFDENAHEQIDNTGDVSNNICKGNVSNSTVHSKSLCNEQTSLNRPHVCSQCGKKFQKILSLKLHMYTHTGKKPFECSLCPKSFHRMKQLVRHSSEQHGNEVIECRKKIASGNKDIAHKEKFVTNYMQSHDRGHNKSLETNQKQIHKADQEKIDTTDEWEQQGNVHQEMHSQSYDILSQLGNTESSKSRSKGLSLKSRSHEIPKPYSCSECGKKFRNTSHRKEHMYTHTGKKPFECSLCSKSFSRKRNLVNHSLSIHGVLTVDQVFHGVTADQVSLGVTVGQDSHGVAVDQVSLGVTVDQVSLGVTVDQVSLGVTVDQVSHGVTVDQVSHEVAVDQVSHGVTADRVSNSGNKSSEDQTEILAHKQAISKGLSLKSKSYEFPKHISTRPYACTQCEKRFKRNDHLKEHMDTHTGKKPFLCCICQQSFARKRAFVSHSLRVHGFINNQLSEQGYKFFSKPKVLVYKLSFEDCLEQINSPGDKSRSLEIPKPYSCSQCERKFRQANHLKEHMYTHTGKNPFECSLCPKSFRRRTDHVNRSLRHHGVIVNQETHGVTVDQVSYGVTVDQNSYGVTVDQVSHGVMVEQVSNVVIVDQETPGVTADRKTHGVTVDQVSNGVTADRETHGVTVDQVSHGVTTDEESCGLTADQVSHRVTADQVSHGVNVDQESCGVTVDQVSHGVTTDEESCGVSAGQETHRVTVDQVSLGVAVDQVSHGVTVDQETHGVTVDQENPGVTADQETHGVTVDQETHGVTVDQETPGVTADRVSNSGNKFSEYQTEILAQKKPISKGISLKSRSHEIPKPYGCSVCGKKFRKTSHRKEHMYTHTGKKPFECSLCSKSFSRKRNLVNHSLSIHGVTVDQVSRGVTVDQVSHGVTADQVSHGVTVDQVSNSGNESSEDQPEILAHKKTISKGLSLKSRSYEIPKHISTRPYACTQCEKRFKRNDHLKEHMYTHTGKRPFECSLCPKSFRRRTELGSHLLRDHGVAADQVSREVTVDQESNSEKQPIDSNQKDTSDQDNMQISHGKDCTDHNLSVHTNNDTLNYVCSCGESFHSVEQLTVHTKTVGGGEPMKCPNCDEVFCERSSYICHILMHLEKKQKCPECEQTFRWSYELTAHMKSHLTKSKENKTLPTEFRRGKKLIKAGSSKKDRKYGTYVCSQCNKRFRKSSCLREHIAYFHTGEKYLSCSKCSSTFVKRKSLIWHSAKHHGVVLDQICECGKGFSSKAEVIAHITTHGTVYDQGNSNEEESNKVFHNSDSNMSLVETQTSFKEPQLSKEISEKTRSIAMTKDLFDDYDDDQMSISSELNGRGTKSDESSSALTVVETQRENGQESSLEELSDQTVDERLCSCSECQQHFPGKLSLLQHLMRCHEDVLNKVCECGERFASEEALYSHQRELLKCNKCPICKKTFEGQCLYELHMEIHAELQYKCTECEDKFAFENQLINHLQFHTGGKPFACSMCKASFSQDSSLAEHLQMHKKENLYECVKCGILFVNENEICKHERKVHKHCWCPVCDKHFHTSNQYEEHMQMHEEDPIFECLKCRKQYPNIKSLKRHAACHDERKILKCLTCDKLFTRENLRKHVKWHRSIRPHKCIQCGKGYIDRHELKKHIIRVHTKRTPAVHLCHICGRACVSEARLLIHVESVHKKQEFHTCPDCGYSVASKQLLSQHLYICRGGKPYKCTICQDLFSDKYELNRHIKRHAGKKQCHVCKRQFKSIYDVNLHVRRVHTGERPFQCSHCQARFLGTSELRAHMRWHYGVKRFKCPLCRKAFITTTSRNRHLKKVHKEVNYLMCDKCGQRFSGFDEILNHRKRLYKETPHLCVVCENRYQTICELTVHLKTHSNMEQ